MTNIGCTKRDDDSNVYFYRPYPGGPMLLPNEQYTVGIKYDENKLPYALLPPDALDALAAVLRYGAAKYADRNWELGMNWSRLVSAAERHIAAFKAREDNDPETRLPHLAHAMCDIMFLLAYQLRNDGTDDRGKAVELKFRTGATDNGKHN